MNQYFTFLNVLQESGKTNMYGAGAYLEEEFDLTRHQAREILMAWMKFKREESS